MHQSDKDSMPYDHLPPTGQGEKHWAPPPGWGDQLTDHGFGAVQWVESTGSTNADLLGIPHQGVVQAPSLRWAGFQQAGRGRRGRRWVGQPGAAITFSVAIERLLNEAPTQNVAPAAFSLVAGLMVAQAIEASHLSTGQPSLKWPNDVLIGGAKVAGILVEVSQHRPIQRLVVGCGLNLRSPDADQLVDGPAHAIKPVGLLDQQDDGPVRECSPTEAAALVTDIAIRLREAHELFFAQGFAAFAQDWITRHAFHQQPIRLSDADHLLAEGICAGIAPDGAILIDLPDGQRAFDLGELSARPVATGGAGPVATLSLQESVR